MSHCPQFKKKMPPINIKNAPNLKKMPSIKIFFHIPLTHLPPIKKKCPQLKTLEIPLIRLPPNLKKMPPIIKFFFPNSTNTFAPLPQIKKKNAPNFIKK